MAKIEKVAKPKVERKRTVKSKAVHAQPVSADDAGVGVGHRATGV